MTVIHDRESLWQRWVRQPQHLWLRRAVFQIHLWSGIGLGLYISMISVTGSVLVYSNELYRAATPAVRGASVPVGIRLVSRLIDLHDNLLAGSTGRVVNGFGALALLVLAVSGLVVWWPGIKAWRRSLAVHRRVGWKRLTWELHGAIGFWSLAFIAVFGLSGAYLGIPQPLQDLTDRLEPLTSANAGTRIGDRALYWLAVMHFGRINGFGFPCGGPGLCDQVIKAIWAVFGLTPALLFATGAVMWWNRVLRRQINN